MGERFYVDVCDGDLSATRPDELYCYGCADAYQYLSALTSRFVQMLYLPVPPAPVTKATPGNWKLILAAGATMSKSHSHYNLRPSKAVDRKGAWWLLLVLNSNGSSTIKRLMIVSHLSRSNTYLTASELWVDGIISQEISTYALTLTAARGG